MATRVAGEQYERITRQLFEIARQIGQPNGYPFDLEILRRHLQAAIEGKLKDPPVIAMVPATYPLTVNYDLSVEEAVKLGRYDSTSEEITSSHFPTKQRGVAKVVLQLVCFSGPTSIENARRELDEIGMRFAEIHELLAFGEKYPDVQREFPVAALGSEWRRGMGSYVSPGLRAIGFGRERRLDLCSSRPTWVGPDRFAVIPKSVSEAAV